MVGEQVAQGALVVGVADPVETDRGGTTEKEDVGQEVLIAAFVVPVPVLAPAAVHPLPLAYPLSGGQANVAAQAAAHAAPSVRLTRAAAAALLALGHANPI